MLEIPKENEEAKETQVKRESAIRGSQKANRFFK
jgi:hypothetical protein